MRVADERPDHLDRDLRIGPAGKACDGLRRRAAARPRARRGRRRGRAPRASPRQSRAAGPRPGWRHSARKACSWLKWFSRTCGAGRFTEIVSARRKRVRAKRYRRACPAGCEPAMQATCVPQDCVDVPQARMAWQRATSLTIQVVQPLHIQGHHRPGESGRSLTSSKCGVELVAIPAVRRTVEAAAGQRSAM